MLKFTDILVFLLEGIIFLVLGIFILEAAEYPLLALPLAIVFILVHIVIKRKKHILKYVAKDFEKIGYTLISERPLRFSELDLSIKPSATINGVPTGRYAYIRKFTRVFTAKNNKNQELELNTVITKKWSGEISIEIKDDDMI